MRHELNSFFDRETAIKSGNKRHVFDACDFGNLSKLEFFAIPVENTWDSRLLWKGSCGSDQVFAGNAFAQSRFDKRKGKPVFFGPDIDVFGYAFNRQKILGSSVAVLRGEICPTAILFAIAFVVVDAVKRCFWVRAWAHVLVEVFKRLPSLANRDAATSVVLVGVMRWIVASFSHAVPNLVFRGFGKAVSELVDSGGAGIARLKDAFTLCVSKLSSLADGLGSARATTEPPLLSRRAVFFGGFGFTNYGPKAKLLAGEVDGFAHVITPFNKSNYRSISKS